MIESLAIYLLVGSLCFGLGYACGTHATWLPALGGKIKSGVGGLFSRKVASPAPPVAIEPSVPWPRPVQPAPQPAATTQPLFWMQPPGDQK